MDGVWLPGGVYTEFLVSGDQTDDAFTLLRDHPPAGWRMPLHRHLGESETIHVVRGVFEFAVDGSPRTYGPGDTVHIPARAPHSGALLADAPGERLLVFSPGGMDRLFERIGVAGPADPIDPARALALAREHGWRFGEEPDEPSA